MSSPALNNKVFEKSRGEGFAIESAMTIKGTINKTFMLLLLAVLGASISWRFVMDTTTISTANTLMYVGLFGGLIFALIAIFSPKNSPWAAPLYAIFEGLCLGGISALFEVTYQGIVMQAVLITFGVLFLMLILYRTGAIKVTQKLRSGIIVVTGGVALFYIVALISSFFTPTLISFINGATALSIGLSFLVAGIAAFNFLLDFDFIDKGVEAGAPKYMEWYGAFGLMLTLVWLYLEILRLLSKFSRR